MAANDATPYKGTAKRPPAKELVQKNVARTLAAQSVRFVANGDGRAIAIARNYGGKGTGQAHLFTGRTWVEHLNIRQRRFSRLPVPSPRLYRQNSVISGANISACSSETPLAFALVKHRRCERRGRRAWLTTRVAAGRHFCQVAGRYSGSAPAM